MHHCKSSPPSPFTTYNLFIELSINLIKVGIMVTPLYFCAYCSLMRGDDETSSSGPCF